MWKSLVTITPSPPLWRPWCKCVLGYPLLSRKLDLQILSTTQMLKAKMLSYNRMATNDETCHQHWSWYIRLSSSNDVDMTKVSTFMIYTHIFALTLSSTLRMFSMLLFSLPPLWIKEEKLRRERGRGSLKVEWGKRIREQRGEKGCKT